MTETNIEMKTVWRRIAMAGSVCLLAYLALAVMSPRLSAIGLAPYFAALATAWGGTLAAWVAVRSLHRSGHRALVAQVWVWAVLFRLVGLASVPLLEDDYWRYLWDGRQFAVTGNPYAGRPLDHFADPNVPEPFQRVLDGINHPDTPTIYGPTCQWAFLISYGLAPAQLWPWKVLLILADLIVVRLLFVFGGLAVVLFYAWCPLLIQETAFTGHPETLGVLFLMSALVARERRQWLWLGAALALSGGTKVYGLLLAPFLLWGAPGRAWVSFGLALAGLYAPFISLGSGSGFEALAIMARTWEFNSSVYAIVSAMSGPAAGRILCGIVFSLFYAWCFWRWRGDQLGRQSFPGAEAADQPAITVGLWVYGMFFLLSPAVNAWYLLWLLPFVALRPKAWGVTALAAVSLSYATGLHLGQPGLAAYEHPAWVRLVEFGSIALAAAWDFARWFRSKRE